jgi:hypothetical protein
MDLIEKLRALKQPDRRVDIEIAMLAGYRREIDEKERRVLWFDAKGADPVRIPPYTSSIDHAREFAQLIVPGYVGGYSWEPGMGSARINDGPYIEAVSPEIALCIAALQANLNRETEEQ